MFIPARVVAVFIRKNTGERKASVQQIELDTGFFRAVVESRPARGYRPRK